MGIQLKNNASSLLASNISSTDTSLTITSGTGGLFPALATGDYFYATLVNTTSNIEIVKVTARADDTFTILRAQEGTIAQVFSAGSRVELRVTVQNVVDSIVNQDFLLL